MKPTKRPIGGYQDFWLRTRLRTFAAVLLQAEADYYRTHTHGTDDIDWAVSECKGDIGRALLEAIGGRKKTK